MTAATVNAQRAQLLRQDGWTTDQIADTLDLPVDQVLDLLAIRRQCACPCHAPFIPPHARQIYINPNHKQRAYRETVKTAARARGLPDHLNLHTVGRTTHRNGDAQSRRNPDLRVSYHRAVDKLTTYVRDIHQLSTDDATAEAHAILRPLLTDRQRAHLDQQASA